MEIHFVWKLDPALCIHKPPMIDHIITLIATNKCSQLGMYHGGSFNRQMDHSNNGKWGQLWSVQSVAHGSNQLIGWNFVDKCIVFMAKINMYAYLKHWDVFYRP